MDYTVHGIVQARILEVGSLSLLQQIFPTQGLNPGLPHCMWILYQLSYEGMQPNSLFLAGEFHGLYSPWGCKKLDMTERLSLSFSRGSS